MVGTVVMRSGRPWGSLKGEDPALHDLARYLRGIVDESKLTSREVGIRCGCSDSTVSKRLGGDQLPDWQFVAALIDACTVGQHRMSDRRRAVREVWNRAVHSHYLRPSKSSSGDSRAMILEAQTETISAQRELLNVTDELRGAHKQLADSVRMTFQASQMIFVLQTLLARLSLLISDLAQRGDRHRAEAAGFREKLEAVQCWRVVNEHEHPRASTLFGESRAKISLLEIRFGEDERGTSDGVAIAGVGTGPMSPLLDDLLFDMAAGFDRVQRLLSEQYGERQFDYRGSLPAFLSELAINVQSHEFRRDYANIHDMHRTVMRAYSEIVSGMPARLHHKVLWRLDAAKNGYTQYVQSHGEPDWGNLPAGLLVAPPEVRPLSPVLGAIAPGQKFSFRLLANATYSARIENGKDVRKRRAHATPAAQIQWLIRRGERDGFVIPTTRLGEPDVTPSVVPTLIGQKKECGKITVVPVRFDGHLIITDAKAFADAMINGVGRAKAYGCGLISLAPPRLGE